MDALAQGIITLLRSGLTGEKLTLPEGFDWGQANELLRKHQIRTVCYMGAVNCGVSKSLPVMHSLFRDYCMILQYSERQWSKLEQLLCAFDRAHIDHMPLKGYGLKSLYPSPELRIMGDADILIRLEQYDAIRPIMQALGFREGQESDHELIWACPELTVELHKHLIPSYNKDYFRYFGDGWQLAVPGEGHRYAMSREDEFVYLFTHFAKHYRDGGIGCRHLADLWLFRRAYAPDEQQLCAKLEPLGLLKFYGNICRVLSVWFEQAEADAMTDHITAVVLNSGSWGARSAHVVAAVARESGQEHTVAQTRCRRALRLLFPPLAAMQQKYPLLRRAPVLLPLGWLVRGISALFSGDKVIRHGKEQLYATEKRVSQYEQALHYVGLDFHFEE